MPVPRVKFTITYATAADETLARVVETYHLRDLAPPTEVVNELETVDGLPLRVREVSFAAAADAAVFYERMRAFLEDPVALPPGVLPAGRSVARVRGTVMSYLCSHNDPVVVSCRTHPSSQFAEAAVVSP